MGVRGEQNINMEMKEVGQEESKISKRKKEKKRLSERRERKKGK